MLRETTTRGNLGSSLTLSIVVFHLPLEIIFIVFTKTLIFKSPLLVKFKFRDIFYNKFQFHDLWRGIKGLDLCFGFFSIYKPRAGS